MKKHREDLQMNVSSLRRNIKNLAHNYTDAQVKVREATSNDPWGPESILMSEIADLTYNVVAFTDIMQMVWKRLNDHGKNWRHVYKALVLLEYLIKTGSEKVWSMWTLRKMQHKCNATFFVFFFLMSNLILGWTAVQREYLCYTDTERFSILRWNEGSGYEC